MKDFNFQLFGVLRGSTLRFDGSPSLYSTFNSNVHRGVHELSQVATNAYEDGRKIVSEFIGAKSNITRN